MLFNRRDGTIDTYFGLIGASFNFAIVKYPEDAHTLMNT